MIGLIAEGIDHLKIQHPNIKIPQEWALQFIGQTLQIEQRNREMNLFIAKMIEKMRKDGIYALLEKGQGIAQCYEKPMWRTSGDIDLFLSNDNYEKAKGFLQPLVAGGKPERHYSKELGQNIGDWYVELHGTLRTGLSTRVDMVVDEVQRKVFNEGRVRSWMNGKTQVFLPAADEDVFFVFTHFVKHFYKEGGVSVRQLCDWCRLLFCYHEKLDVRLLKSRIRKAGLMSEWRSFAAIAVKWLGMPVEAMPMCRSDKKWSKKAKKIVPLILKGGKWRRFKDTLAAGRIFPVNTLRFLPGILFSVTWLKVRERFVE